MVLYFVSYFRILIVDILCHDIVLVLNALMIFKPLKVLVMQQLD